MSNSEEHTRLASYILSVKLYDGRLMDDELWDKLPDDEYNKKITEIYTTSKHEADKPFVNYLEIYIDAAIKIRKFNIINKITNYESHINILNQLYPYHFKDEKTKYHMMLSMALLDQVKQSSLTRLERIACELQRDGNNYDIIKIYGIIFIELLKEDDNKIEKNENTKNRCLALKIILASDYIDFSCYLVTSTIILFNNLSEAVGKILKTLDNEVKLIKNLIETDPQKRRDNFHTRNILMLCAALFDNKFYIKLSDTEISKLKENLNLCLPDLRIFNQKYEFDVQKYYPDIYIDYDDFVNTIKIYCYLFIISEQIEYIDVDFKQILSANFIYKLTEKTNRLTVLLDKTTKIEKYSELFQKIGDDHKFAEFFKKSQFPQEEMNMKLLLFRNLFMNYLKKQNIYNLKIE